MVERLSRDTLALVAAHLGPYDLAALELTSRGVRRALLECHDAYRWVLLSHFGGPEAAAGGVPPGYDYRAEFVRRSNELGAPFLPYVARVGSAWRRIRAWAAEHCPRLLQSLQPGLTGAAIVSRWGWAMGAARHLGPEAFDSLMGFLCFARLCSGQAVQTGDGFLSPALFGSASFYGNLSVVYYAPLTSAFAPPEAHLNVGQRLTVGPDISRAPVRLDPARNFAPVCNGRVVAPSFVDMLETTADRLVRGGDDLEGLFQDEQETELSAAVLSSANVSVAELRGRARFALGYLRFRFDHVTSSDAVTGCVRAQAAVVQVEGLLFTYRIRLQLTAATPPGFRAVLESRRWVITHGEGTENEHVEVVEGAGVVGQFPELSSDTPRFAYQSCIQQAAPMGGPIVMEGSLLFRQHPHGDILQVRVAPFRVLGNWNSGAEWSPLRAAYRW